MSLETFNYLGTTSCGYTCPGACRAILCENGEFRKRISTVELTIETLVKNIEKLQKIIEAKITPSSSTNTEDFSKAIDERFEQERRKCNVVVAGFAEATLEEDKTFVTDLLTVVNVNTSFVATRVGKLTPGKNRLLRICFPDESIRKQVLSKSKALKSLDENETDAARWKKVYIKPDLTKAQQTKDKQLRDELKKSREERPNDDLIIRNGKIVPRPKATINT